MACKHLHGVPPAYLSDIVSYYPPQSSLLLQPYWPPKTCLLAHSCPTALTLVTPSVQNAQLPELHKAGSFLSIRVQFKYYLFRERATLLKSSPPAILPSFCLMF